MILEDCGWGSCLEVVGGVIASGVVTVSAVQVPRLEISIPSKQGLKLKNNLHKFEKAILKGPTHKCFSCERLCYEQLGALYRCDVANDLLAVVNESIQEVFGCVTSARVLWKERKFHQDHSLIK